MCARWLPFALAVGSLACGSPGRESIAAPSISSPVAASAATPPSASGRAAPAAPDPEDPAALMTEVRFLASSDLRGRGSASPDERRAAEHLAGEMREIGLLPMGPSFIEEFDAGGRRSANVVGLLVAGPVDAQVVVLGAHYDHLGVRGKDVYLGADDNASGVAAALGVMRKLARDKTRLGRSVILALFGSEEIGLLGSRAFVARGPIHTSEIVVMINVDMVGRPLSDQALLRPAARFVGIDPDHSVGVDGLRGRPLLDAIVRGACEAEHEKAITIDDLPESLRATAEMMTEGRGDNWSFEAAGVPSVFISSAESNDYHMPTDTPDTLSPDLLAERTRILERVVVGASHLATRP